MERFIRFDQMLKIRYEKIAAKTSAQELQESIAIMADNDYFGDGEIRKCEHCSNIGFMRPWLSDFVDQHKLHVLCMECGKKMYPKLVIGALVQQASVAEESGL